MEASCSDVAITGRSVEAPVRKGFPQNSIMEVARYTCIAAIWRAGRCIRPPP